MKTTLALAAVAFLAFAGCTDEPDIAEAQAALGNDDCDTLMDQAQDAVGVLKTTELRGEELEIAGAKVADAFDTYIATDCKRGWDRAYGAIEPAAKDFGYASTNTAGPCGTDAANAFRECQDACKAAGKKFCGCVAILVIDIGACLPGL
jgi:hypothetical protein